MKKIKAIDFIKQCKTGLALEICKDFGEEGRVWEKSRAVLEICIKAQWKYGLDARNCRSCYDLYAAANRVRILWEQGEKYLNRKIVWGGDFDALAKKERKADV